MTLTLNWLYSNVFKEMKMTVLNSDAAPEVSSKLTQMPQVRMASSLTLSLMKLLHFKAFLKDVVVVVVVGGVYPGKKDKHFVATAPSGDPS